jgi:hypothetical protein
MTPKKLRALMNNPGEAPHYPNIAFFRSLFSRAEWGCHGCGFSHGGTSVLK